MKLNKTMLRHCHEADLPALYQMIHDAIEASYSGVYPPRAVDFFRDHHSMKNIAGRIIIVLGLFVLEILISLTIFFG